MILGALTHNSFVLKNALLSEDTTATLEALVALGSEVRAREDGVHINCDKLQPVRDVIDAKNSGTTIRLMVGLASLLPARTTLTGDQSLVRRPMGPLVDSLRELGATCSYLSVNGRPPLSVSGPITGSRTRMVGNVSSQFVSSLLISCSQKKGDTTIDIEGELRSRPYVDITIQMLEDFGGSVSESSSGFKIPGGQTLSRDSFAVPGDYSSAAFPLVAAAITGGDVTVRNLDPDSPQGDRALVEHLAAFGAKVVESKDSVRVSAGDLQGSEISVRDTPDLFPILAVLGSVAEGRTTLTGGENLREKESDRIATTTAFLHAMGARIKPREDGCEILGGEKLHGTTIQTEGDHRILMAAAVAALVATSDTRIEDSESHRVSYPGFLSDMHQLGCRMEVRS